MKSSHDCDFSKRGYLAKLGIAMTRDVNIIYSRVPYVQRTFRIHPLTGGPTIAYRIIWNGSACAVIYSPDDGFNGCAMIDETVYEYEFCMPRVKQILLAFFSPEQVQSLIEWCKYGRMWCFTKYRW